MKLNRSYNSSSNSLLALALLLLSGCAGNSPAFYLPFEDCERSWIRQGFLGPYSHMNSYAIDWSMLNGTVVTAALGGTVVKTRNDAIIGDLNPDGRFPSGNYIIIRHDNGILSRYLHLKTNSIVVEHGQKVKAGEPIGLTGATGNVGSQPHLHFDAVTGRSSSNKTLPFKVIDKTGEPQKVELGRWYETACP